LNDRLKEALEAKDISLTLMPQAANSPDNEVHDLAVFRATQSVQQNNPTQTIDELIQAVHEPQPHFFLGSLLVASSGLEVTSFPQTFLSRRLFLHKRRTTSHEPISMQDASFHSRSEGNLSLLCRQPFGSRIY
jgi:hypothetical protein